MEARAQESGEGGSLQRGPGLADSVLDRFEDPRGPETFARRRTYLDDRDARPPWSDRARRPRPLSRHRRHRALPGGVFGGDG